MTIMSHVVHIYSAYNVYISRCNKYILGTPIACMSEHVSVLFDCLLQTVTINSLTNI